MYHNRVLQHTLPFLTSPPRSQASTEENSSHCYAKRILGSNVESSLRKISRNQGLRLPTHGSPKVAVSTSCVECLRVAGSVPTFSGILVADLIHELKMQFPNATIIHNWGVGWAEGILYVDDLRLISTDAGGKNSR